MPDPVVQFELLGLGSSPFEVQAYQIHVPVGVAPVPGVAVTLIAHEIVFDDGAVLDVSGMPGSAQLQAASADAPGASGSPGTAGNNGTDGGSITLYAEVITGTAQLTANGGAGGVGEEGGAGFRGQPGGPGEDGEDGSAPGAGGPGGNGGQGGTVVVLCADLSGADLAFSVQGGAGAAPGDPGAPGPGGAPGNPGGTWQASPPTHGASGPKMFWIPGPITHPGRSGPVPPPSARGADGADGSAASTADSGALIPAIVGSATQAYWSMLLTNGTQSYYDDDYTDAANLLGWINTIGSNGTSAVDTIVNRARVLITQMAEGLDVYGHPRNYVQALSVGAYEVTNTDLVSDGVALEATLADYQAQLEADTLRLKAIEDAIAKATAQLNKNQKIDRPALIVQGAKLNQQLLELLSEELAAMSVVNQTSAELQAALSAGHSCSFSEIISAATLICTVAASFFGPAGIIAGAATAGADLLAAAPTFSDLLTVVKDVKVIGGDIGQLETTYNNLKVSLGGNAPDPKNDSTKFLMSDSDLATVRAQFEAKIKTLPASPDKDAYNDAVNHYLDIVQLRNQQLLSFNGLAFKLASLDDSANALLASIKALNDDLDPALAAEITAEQQVQDITSVRNSLLQSVFFELLQQSRALDFWTLNPQDPPSGNDSFDALQGVLGTLLARREQALEVFANPPASFSSAAGGLVIPLSSAGRAALAKNGTYSFLISVDHPVFSNLAQVLVGQMTVTFNAADGSVIQPLRLNLEHSGYHKFRDVNGQIYEFITPSRSVVQDIGGPIQTVSQFAGEDTSLDSGNPAAASYVGVSPFTRWKITAMDDPGVFAALGKAKEISLSVSGTARAFVGSA